MKHPVKAFAIINEKPTEITVISYDGDKRATVECCGEITEIKRGFITKNPCKYDEDWDVVALDGTKPKYFTWREWWELEGNDVRDYNPRKRKTEWIVDYNHHYTFNTKKEAVKKAIHLCKSRGFDKVDIFSEYTDKNSWASGGCDIIVQSSGFIFQYGYVDSRCRRNGRSGQARYMKGHGKKSEYNDKRGY